MTDNQQNISQTNDDLSNDNNPLENELQEEIDSLNDNSGIADIINNLKNLSNEENLSNLFKEFTSNIPTNTNDNSDFEDNNESDDYEYEALNLDKYLISSNGNNICDILSNIELQLNSINENLNKMHDK